LAERLFSRAGPTNEENGSRQRGSVQHDIGLGCWL